MQTILERTKPIALDQTDVKLNVEPNAIIPDFGDEVNVDVELANIEDAYDAQPRLKPVSAPDAGSLKVIADVIMSAHGRALERSVGLQGTGRQSREHVEAIVYTVFSFQPERYACLEAQAADLAVRLATGHCFPDGNKRTSVLSAAVVMEAYGRSVSCSQSDLVEAAMLAACGDSAGVEAKLCS